MAPQFAFLAQKNTADVGIALKSSHRVGKPKDWRATPQVQQQRPAKMIHRLTATPKGAGHFALEFIAWSR